MAEYANIINSTHATRQTSWLSGGTGCAGRIETGHNETGGYRRPHIEWLNPET